MAHSATQAVTQRGWPAAGPDPRTDRRAHGVAEPVALIPGRVSNGELAGVAGEGGVESAAAPDLVRAEHPEVAVLHRRLCRRCGPFRGERAGNLSRRSRSASARSRG